MYLPCQRAPPLQRLRLAPLQQSAQGRLLYPRETSPRLAHFLYVLSYPPRKQSKRRLTLSFMKREPHLTVAANVTDEDKDEDDDENIRQEAHKID